jgi:uncharacterized membrane-anchored protein
MKQKIYFLVIVMAQVVLIFVMFSFYQTILNSGTEIWLKTRPVDPRDIFRGDYIQLDYEINHVNDVPDYLNLQSGDIVFVPTYPSGKFTSVQAYNISKESCQNYFFCIKGKVVNVNSGNYDTVKNIDVDYGINQYFIKEGTGQNIDQASIYEVKTVVDKNSIPLIKEVWRDGKKI